MSFASNMYDMMVLRSLTIGELSDKSGMSRNQIYRLLGSKDRNLSLKGVKKLSAALGCTPAWLLRDTE